MAYVIYKLSDFSGDNPIVCVCGVWGGGTLIFFFALAPPPHTHTGSCLKCLHTGTPPPPKKKKKKKIPILYKISETIPSPRLRSSEQGLNKVRQLYTCRDPEMGQGSGPPDNHKLPCISLEILVWTPSLEKQRSVRPSVKARTALCEIR